jgi:phenylacetate-CoA ligase
LAPSLAYTSAIDARRRQAQFAQLDGLIKRVLETNAFQRARLSGVSISSPADLRALPFTTKEELLADQNVAPPYGSNLTFEASEYTQVHVTSGTIGTPLSVPQTAEDWSHTRACFARVLREAGITAADRVAMPFGFGPYLRYWAAVAGVEEIGALSLPLGGLEVRERLNAISTYQATAMICTPSDALRLIDLARGWGLERVFSSVQTLLCQGEPGASIAATRERIEDAWGARVFDHAGSTEVGVFSYPCVSGGGLHVIEEEFLCEVLDPCTGEEVGAGGQGELVLTALSRSGFPAIRFRGGDIVELGGSCPAGHLDAWLPNGIVGRTEDMVVVGGQNVFPSEIEQTLREAGALGPYRLRFHGDAVDRDDVRVLVETTDPTLVRRIEDSVLQRLGVRVRVVAVMPGVLSAKRHETRRVEAGRPSKGFV